MSDPLSVAGTAVGITSLGIQVCQGLVSYVQSIEGRSKAITEGLKEVQSLASIFHALNDVLSKIDQRQPVQSCPIRNCLRSNEDKLIEVQQQLLGLRGSLNDGVGKRKIKEIGRSLVYPFREGTLTSLRESLQALLNDLSVSISVVSLEHEILNYDKIDSIEKAAEGLKASGQTTYHAVSNLSNRIRENSHQLHFVERKISDSIDGLGTRMDRTEWFIRDIGQNVNAKLTLMESKMQSDSAISPATAAALLEQMRAQTTHMEAQTLMMSSMLQKQDAQSSFGHAKDDATHDSDKQHDLQPLCFPRGSRMSELILHKRPTSSKGPETEVSICACYRRGQTFKFAYTLGRIKLQYEQQIPAQHSRGCKYHGINNETTRVLKTQFPIMMGWFSGRLTLGCLDFTYGTGNLGASIRYRNIVEESLVAQELDCMVLDLENITAWGSHDARVIQEMVQRVESTERAVISLYRQRKASPSDRDVSGKSHVDLLVQIVTNQSSALLRLSRGQDLFHPAVVTAYIRFIQTLQNVCYAEDAMAVSLFFLMDTLNDMDDTAATLGVLELFSYFTENFEVDLFSPLYCAFRSGWRKALNHLSKLPGAMKGLYVKSLPRAILEQSLKDVDNCIAADPNSIFETPFFLTCLEMAVVWPEGLQRLLQTEARILIEQAPSARYDLGRFIPSSRRVSYSKLVKNAIDMDCDASLAILMKEDHFIDFNIVNTAVRSRACARVIASNLSQRRRRLYHLAELGVKDLRRPSSSCSLDGMAAHICKELNNANILIPPALYVADNYTTIYNTGIFPIYCYDILLENGFYELKTHNDIGLTPVMTCHHSKDQLVLSDREMSASLNWLVDQGCFDQKPIDSLQLGLNTSATAWHYFASHLGSSYPKLRELLVNCLMRSQTSTADDCICWCNSRSGGCSPFGSFLKAVTARAQREPSPLYPTFNDLYHLIPLNGEALIQLIRFITFEALEMTHTCCFSTTELLNSEEDPVSIGWSNLLVICDPSKRQRVRSSQLEKDNAKLLDDLMEDFTNRIEHLDFSPSTNAIHIHFYWRYRISQEFRVDSEAADDLKLLGERLQTHILPDRLRYILGKSFELLKDDELDAMEARWRTKSELGTMLESDEEFDESEVRDETEDEADGIEYETEGAGSAAQSSMKSPAQVGLSGL